MLEAVSELVARFWRMAVRGIKTMLVVGLLGALLLVGVAGCSPVKQDKAAENPLDVSEQMEQYLEGKYGSLDYQTVGLIRAGFNQGYDTLTAYPVGGDPEQDQFLVNRYEEGGSYRFEDNYFGLLIRDEAEALLQGIADKHYKQSKVYLLFGRSMLPDELNGTSTFEDYLAIDDEYAGSIWLATDDDFANQQEFEATSERFIQSLKNAKIVPLVRAYWFTPQSYSKIETVQDLQRENDNPLGRVYIGKDE
jgi:hypothetical protein